MEMIYKFSADNTLKGITFKGLTGTEPVSSAKEAVQILSITNPAKQFADRMKADSFNGVPEYEIDRLAKTANMLSSLWTPEGENLAVATLNPLSILANSLVLNVKLWKELKELKKK